MNSDLRTLHINYGQHILNNAKLESIIFVGCG